MILSMQVPELWPLFCGPWSKQLKQRQSGVGDGPTMGSKMRRASFEAMRGVLSGRVAGLFAPRVIATEVDLHAFDYTACTERWVKK